VRKPSRRTARKLILSSCISAHAKCSKRHKYGDES